MDARFSDSEILRRRQAAGRLGWLIAAGVLVLYVIGLFIKR